MSAKSRRPGWNQGVRTVARIRQAGEIAEPVEIAFRYPVEGGHESELTLAFDPSDPQLAARRDVRVDVLQVSDNEWDVSVELPSPPKQIEVDPEHWVPDANPRNNHWRPDIAVRYSPLYTPIDESAIVQPWEQQSIVFGPGVDEEARVGFFASLIRRTTIASLVRRLHGRQQPRPSGRWC